MELRWTPFYTLMQKEIRRFFKVVVQTVCAPIVSAALYLLIFGVSLGRSIEGISGWNYLAFLIPGLVTMGCLNNAFQNSASSIVGSKFSGDLEEYRTSALSNTQVIWALSFGGLVRGVIVGGLTFVVGEVFYKIEHNLWLPIIHPGWLILFLTIGGLSFAMLGLSAAFWAKSFDQMSAFGSFILLPLIYLGGVFFSLESLHPFWRQVSQLNPLLYLINGVRYAVLGSSDIGVLPALAVSIASLLVFYSIAMLSLKKGSYVRW